MTIHQFSLSFDDEDAPSPPATGGLHIFQAASPDVLLRHLAERFRSDPLPPYEFEAILLPHGSALRPWLTQKLAGHLGCAASLYMPTVREYADALIRRLLSSDPSAFDRRSLTWRIFTILSDESASEDLAPVREYLNRAGGELMPLSRRLAQLFDSYQTFRPQLLERWRQGGARADAEVWQSRLWNRIIDQMPDAAADRGELMRQLIRRLDAAHVGDLPTRISIFAETLLPPVYLDFLRALARHVDVTWYVAGALSVGHPLADVLGEDARMAEALRANLAAATTQRLTAPGTSGATSTALSVIQQDVRAGRRRSSNERLSLAADDASLRIHDCHSPIRELEVLRDQLLDAFESIEDLRPSDVLVVVPDLDRYAPLIEAVFAAGDQRQRLPVAVARDPREAGRRYLAAFRSLLEAMGSRLTAGAVLELLSEPAIARKARLDSDAVEVIRGWIRATHIRWGIDGAHRQRFDLPNDHLHTWRFGLDRLLMGIVAGESDASVDGVIPHAEATLDRAPILGRFASWMQDVSDAVRHVTRPRRLEAWREWLEVIIQRFMFAGDEEEQMAEDHLLAELREMTQVAPDIELDFTSLRNHLSSTLGSFEGRGRLLSGAITVADFERLRYVPARVVACVGLNDDAFPRAGASADFDLIATSRRDGDPDLRRLDKQLFLDALLAARDRLILTFNGRSQRDNSERAPSIVIDALLETLTQTFTTGDSNPAADARQVRRWFVVEHPLQPFSTRYFDGTDRRLFSYDRVSCIPPAAELKPIAPFVGRPLPEVEPEDGVIQLYDLIAAWSNPSEFFCKKLDLRLRLSDLTVEDVEPQFLDGLQSYAISTRMLDLLLEGTPEEDVRERLQMEGHFPAGALGHALYTLKRADVDPLLRQVEQFGRPAPVDVDIEVAGRRLVGTIPHVTDAAALHFRPAKTASAKDRITVWIHHLALALSGMERRSWLFAREETESIIKVDEPLEHLRPLVERFADILREPVLLFPISSMVYAKSGKIQSALPAYRGGFNQRVDCDDAFITFLNRHHHPLEDRFDDFEREARELWGPIDKHLTKV